MRYFIDLPMKMEPIVSSETSAIRNRTPGNYPKRNKLHLEHGESLKTRMIPNISEIKLLIWCWFEIKQLPSFILLVLLLLFENWIFL